jgi:TRAP-type mannitol/chloroaromatic compound transport system permease small subunit
LPWLYLLKTLIPAMVLLLILQGVAMVLRNLLAVLAVESAGGEHDAPREI